MKKYQFVRADDRFVHIGKVVSQAIRELKRREEENGRRKNVKKENLSE